MAPFKNLTGKKFGRLTVIRKYGVDKRGNTQWVTKCDCGRVTRTATTGALNSGNTTSCGCLTVEKKFKHGDAGQKTSLYSLYAVWASMKRRCIKSDDPGYPNYGGRGITVCDRWLNYLTFKEWALANGYKKGLIIDRIDNNGNYEPENCRFTTAKISQNNRRNLTYLTAFGETKTQGDWASDPRCKVAYETLRFRISYLSWTAEEAITKPARRN